MPSLIIAVFSPLLQPYVVQKYRIWNLFHLATIDPFHHPLCSVPSHISPLRVSPCSLSHQFCSPFTSVLFPPHMSLVLLMLYLLRLDPAAADEL